MLVLLGYICRRILMIDAMFWLCNIWMDVGRWRVAGRGGFHISFRLVSASLLYSQHTFQALFNRWCKEHSNLLHIVLRHQQRPEVNCASGCDYRASDRSITIAEEIEQS
jgi:hypothetical protein